MRSTGKDLPRAKLDVSWLIFFFSFCVFAAAVILICFVGLSPAGPQIIINQVARVRVVSEIPFSYESAILTKQLVEQRRERVPPVYRLNQDPYNRFSRFIENLNKGLTELDQKTAEAKPEERTAALRDFTNQLASKTRYSLNSENLAALVNTLDADQRNRAIQEGLMILREIYREGIYDSDHADMRNITGTLSLWNIENESGNIAQVEVQSEEDALRSLRINLLALDISREASVALYRILRVGLTPNLEFDPTKTEEKRKQIEANIDPVVINVQEGDTIIEPGTKVRALDLEQLTAYREHLNKAEEEGFNISSLLWERILMTIAILLSAAIYILVGSRQLGHNKQKIALACTVFLLNMALIRLIIELGSLGETNPALTAVLPYLAPVSFGSIVIAVILGAGPAVFVAVLIGVFNALMQGNSIPLLLISVLSSMVGIYICYEVHTRARVVQAGAFAGTTLAVCAFFIGLHSALDISYILQQMAAAIVAGAVTGILVLGILPVFESIFKFTTNISLLELTDFNHPLLRRMQVAAPGSYHHSLMVANLSENAAAEIGANPLVCRVCSLFHDIGKSLKPEYFTENQREGYNPHLLHNPSMSALVIKSHVKEGVKLAREYKLPRIIIDVIKQHHGTTLIQYFYYKALKEKQRDTHHPFGDNAPRIELDEVNESTYRYEGPKPQFKESAIIFFADSIEAASRSLPKVTPQAIDELLDKIFQHRFDDNQLSDCPLNFQEVDKIKRSFSFTLLNMLHSRVEYPSKEDQDEAKAKGDKQKAAAKKQQASDSKAVDAEKSALPHAAQQKATPRSGSQPV